MLGRRDKKDIVKELLLLEHPDIAILMETR